MKCLLKISQDEPEFALAEIDVLTQAKIEENDAPFYTVQINDDKLSLLSRLAYTKTSLQFLFKCELDQIEKTIKSFDWNSIYEESFLVRCYSIEIGGVERKFANFIWGNLKDPKTDLKNPKTKICFFRKENTIYCGKLLHESYATFEYRRNKYKPRKHPTTMHPKFARFLINLSGVNNGTLLDPFCGAGGILIEGSLLGYKIIGYDISQNMLNRCEENLYYFDIKKFDIRKRDAAKIIDRADLVVTDVPYGRNSTYVDSLKETYQRFLDSSYDKIDRMVVVFPHFVDYKSLFNKWKLKKEYEVRCHSGLTRKICVLGK